MRNITLIPWQNDFIPALGRLLVARDDFSRCTVLFTHDRPRRYLKAFFKECHDLPRPVFLPRMTSVTEFTAGLRRELASVPVKAVHRLDLVELLRTIVSDLHASGRGLLARLPELDREAFLPWGMQLAGLLDDLLRQDIEPEDLTYMEGEVSLYASGLLEQLGAIHREYVNRLSERNWTTPGLDCAFVTRNIIAVTEQLRERPVIAAGFYALSGTEDILFRRLWEDGILHPVIHSDPALALGETPHWAAAEHTAWLGRWKTRAEIPEGDEAQIGEPVIHFREGFDRHSQLAALTEDMAAAPDRDGNAVILPDEGALLPVLHNLPDKEPNISMGYPLDRTSLARLVETLLTLQENRLEDGRYYWRDVISLIRHPYLRLLGPEHRPLRRIFHVWEAEIRTGERYIDPLAWHPPYGDEILDGVDRAEAEPLRRSVLDYCLDGFTNVRCLEDLGRALNSLAAMLHEHGEGLWHTYLVDAECLFRLTTSVVPQLRNVEARHEEFSRSTLFALLRGILSGERVSFEPDPLGGLQVLGVLETRQLHFRRLFILDAVEERLPGTNPYDPLLPDALRKLLGLPDARERDNVSGYNFYRLLMGAKEAFIYYQSGVQPGLLDAKSVRSRFVEQLLWEREKREGRILAHDRDVIRTVTFPTGSLQRAPRPVPATEAVRSRLMEILVKRGLSPSGLDRYMQCPKQFFYSYLCDVRPVDQVNEEGDRSEFGSLVHEVLREYLTPHIGRKTRLGELDPEPLAALFAEKFAGSELARTLSFDTRMALVHTGRHRLERFLASQETATLLGLEQRLETTVEITAPCPPIVLKGFLDRVEEREQGVYILDYKTGGGVTPKKAVWEDMDLWDRIHGFVRAEDDPGLTEDVARVVQSIQLPAYMHLYHASEGTVPHNAGLIKLAEDGKTELLFPDKWTEEEREDVVGNMTPLLIRTLINHMLTTTVFAPQPGRRCKWCDFKAPCGQ
ncbi:PD-(D/E)XK nuclease family protein [Pseudodesulfovibrio cashew]|uniref:PD-(D/E)XK nuclease family protein n=1 Tax=Pseudodesulfovibrio cashew TaxID=2678688 RepID=A0A6I6JMR2_9BACT|nr:PD-(D/E)XK nuclease family protein [Pseudodesulfovibrio cashew]QGY41403.1 PD-(D/E)XK nuclease family protein [Pseudodesulfovibrio cashew]